VDLYSGIPEDWESSVVLSQNATRPQSYFGFTIVRYIQSFMVPVLMCIRVA